MKNNRSILIILLFVTSLFSGCKKWVIDYRNKWTGDYSFTITKTYWTGYAWNTTNINADGKIFYRPFHNIGKSITIQIFGEASFTGDVTKSGTLRDGDHLDIDGKITTTNILFTAITSGKPGDRYTVSGIKK